MYFVHVSIGTALILYLKQFFTYIASYSNEKRLIWTQNNFLGNASRRFCFDDLNLTDYSVFMNS